jgi:hypothetical protein
MQCQHLFTLDIDTPTAAAVAAAAAVAVAAAAVAVAAALLNAMHDQQILTRQRALLAAASCCYSTWYTANSITRATISSSSSRVSSSNCNSNTANTVSFKLLEVETSSTVIVTLASSGTGSSQKRVKGWQLQPYGTAIDIATVLDTVLFTKTMQELLPMSPVHCY